MSQNLTRINRALLVLPVLFGLSGAEVITNPEFFATSVGTNVESWSWQHGAPTAEGEYDGDVYKLTGNGHGTYWCWDRGTFSFITSHVTDKNFTFTARLKSIPATGPGLVGIQVRSSLFTNFPVLDLRWDYYWQNATGNGLTWFNRVTPSSGIGMFGQGEKGCNMATGQGCLGLGYENRVAGFTSRENLWLRIRRVIQPSGISFYYCYARYGNDEWTAIPAVSGTNNPCGGTVTAVTRPAFMVPEDVNNLVYVGLSLAAGAYGAGSTTAEFDNIELILDSETSINAPSQASTQHSAKLPWHAVSAKGTVTLNYTGSEPATPVRAALYDLRGSRISFVSSQSGNTIIFNTQNRTGTGVSFVELQYDGKRQIIPITNAGQ